MNNNSSLPTQHPSLLRRLRLNIILTIIVVLFLFFSLDGVERIKEYFEPLIPEIVYVPNDILDRPKREFYYDAGIYFPDNSYVSNYHNSIHTLLIGNINQETLLFILFDVLNFPIPRIEFIPEHYIQPEMRDNNILRTSMQLGRKASETFWYPWIIRYMGGEGEVWCYRAERVGFSNQEEEYFLKAIELGNIKAMYLYAMKDLSQRIHLLIKAADGGNADAQRELARQYRLGDLVPLDPQKARTYYQMAMSEPTGLEYYNMAHMYLAGEGGPVDHLKALTYAHIGGGYFPNLDPGFASQTSLGPAERKQAREEADQILAAMKEQREAKEQEAMERWNALIPELKEDIRNRAPWLLWIFVPQAIREPICEQTYQERLAANNGQFPPPPLPDGTVPIPWPLPVH